MADTKKKATAKKPHRNEAKSRQADAGLSALDLLREDHDEVTDYFEELEQLEDAEEKEILALKICLALQLHAQIEEEIFYPAARKAIKKTELIDEAIVEHGSAKQLIAEIESMEVGDELHDAKVKVLGEQMRHHIEEEENELFPEVEAAKLDLEALGRQMADRKAQLLEELTEEESLR